MSECAGCGKQVTRYRIEGGRDYCYDCAPVAVAHREGFRHEGAAIPTKMDHCTNMGWEKPTKNEQAWEHRQMERVSRAGGETRLPSPARREANKLMQRNLRAMRDMR